MTTLAELLAASSSDVVPPHPQAERPRKNLAPLFDAPRAVTLTGPAADCDTPALIALVGDRAPAAEIGTGAAPAPRRIRRGRGGKDWLSTVIAVAAVVAVFGAGTFAALSFAGDSSATEAMRGLTRSEAVLVDDIAHVNSSVADVEIALLAGQSRANALAAPIAAVSGMTDEIARTAAEAARRQYLAALESISLPAQLRSYRRAAVDDESLSSVGAAIDVVNERTLTVSDARDDLTTANTSLSRADKAFADAMVLFAASVPVAADTVVGENPDAEEVLHTAVRDAAASVAASSAAGLGGALDAYVTAVTALRDGQDRAAEEIAIAEEAARQAELRRQQEQEVDVWTPPVDTAEEPPVDETPVPEPDPVEPSAPVEPTEPTPEG